MTASSIVSNLDTLTPMQKEEMIASLAILLVGNNEVSAEKLVAVAEAAGCTLSITIATLYCNVASKCPGGIIKYRAPPGGGGGGDGGGGGAAAAAAGAVAEVAKEEEKEEEEMDLGGGMDMFGGEEAGAGGGDY